MVQQVLVLCFWISSSDVLHRAQSAIGCSALNELYSDTYLEITMELPMSLSPSPSARVRVFDCVHVDAMLAARRVDLFLGYQGATCIRAYKNTLSTKKQQLSCTAHRDCLAVCSGQLHLVPARSNQYELIWRRETSSKGRKSIESKASSECRWLLHNLVGP